MTLRCWRRNGLCGRLAAIERRRTARPPQSLLAIVVRGPQIQASPRASGRCVIPPLPGDCIEARVAFHPRKRACEQMIYGFHRVLFSLPSRIRHRWLGHGRSRNLRPGCTAKTARQSPPATPPSIGTSLRSSFIPPLESLAAPNSGVRISPAIGVEQMPPAGVIRERHLSVSPITPVLEADRRPAACPRARHRELVDDGATIPAPASEQLVFHKFQTPRRLKPLHAVKSPSPLASRFRDRAL